jgi:DNA-binding XRE family transcriptional regulator
VLTKRGRVISYKLVKTKVVLAEAPYVLFGQAVAEERRRLGMSQQQVADKIGLSRPSITNIELGRQRVLLGDLLDFAKALNMDPVELFKKCLVD